MSSNHYDAIFPGLYLGDIDSRSIVKLDATINVSEITLPGSYNFLLSLEAEPDINKAQLACRSSKHYSIEEGKQNSFNSLY